MAMRRRTSNSLKIFAAIISVNLIALFFVFSFPSETPSETTQRKCSTSQPASEENILDRRFVGSHQFGQMFSLFGFSVEQTPEIFDLSFWRFVLIGNRGNQTLCDVPERFASVVESYCHAIKRENCARIPCTLIRRSEEFDREFQCFRGGKRANQTDFHFKCKRSPALELFDNQEKKPSLMTEAYTDLTFELYGDALFNYHDGKTTKWGLALEGESFGYYPTFARLDRISSLFDITVGYDRRYFDLINDQHLEPFVDAIINRSNKRLTIEQVIRQKKRGRISADE